MRCARPTKAMAMGKSFRREWIQAHSQSPGDEGTWYRVPEFIGPGCRRHVPSTSREWRSPGPCASKPHDNVLYRNLSNIAHHVPEEDFGTTLALRNRVALRSGFLLI